MNSSKTIYMFNIKRVDNSQEVDAIWVIGLIKYTDLKFETYKCWNMKVDCEEQFLTGLKEFFIIEISLVKTEWKILILISVCQQT